MAEYLSPGVFVEERNAGPAVIQGVSTSNYGTCGWLQRGPVGKATLITSFDDFVRIFGSYWTNSYIPYAMSAFFQNGGARAYVVREVPSDAVKASCDVESAGRRGEVLGWRIPATGVLLTTGSNSDIKLTIDATVDDNLDMSGGVNGTYTAAEIAANINAAATGTTPASVVTDSDGYQRILIQSPTLDGVSSIVKVEVPTDTFDGTQAVFGGVLTDVGVDPVLRWLHEAENEGVWGNLVKTCLIGDENYKDTTNGGFTKFNLIVSEESSLGAGDYAVQETIGPFDLADPTANDYYPDVVNNDSDLVRVSAGASPGVPWALTARQITARPILEGDGAAVNYTSILYYTTIVRGSISITDGVEIFTDDGAGSLTGDQGGSGTINYNSGALSLTFAAAVAAGTVVTATYKQESYASQSCCTFTGGADGTAVTRSQVSAPALEASLRGIYAMDKIEDLINISLPDFYGSVAVANDLISWAQNRGDRFIILDPDSGLTPQEVKDYRQFTGNFSTSFAALYYPWVIVSDPVTGRSKTLPPSGWIAGVYARTDLNRNVAKAPAGITDGALVGVIGVEYETSKSERDILYPVNINTLVDTPQTGRAVWGARTMSLEAEWKYVQVRRLFMFLEKSTFLSTHWAVFENNGPGLWAKIRLQLVSFLTNLFNEGYFAGNTPAQAFRVVCDAGNNPQTQIDAGLVTCDVYAAPQKPGEFIRFRFQQMTGQTK